MSNNMINLNRSIFESLWKDLPEDNKYAGSGYLSKKRFINTDAEGKSRLKSASILKSEISHLGQSSMVIAADSRYFVAVSGAEGLVGNAVAGILGDATDCAGLGTYILANKWPKRKFENYRLIDVVAEREGGFDIDEMFEFFEPYQIWNVEKSLVYDLYSDEYSAQRVIIAASLSSFISKLPLSNESFEKLQLMIESPIGWVFTDQFLRVIAAVHFEYAFLDLYRCFERLYNIPYCVDARAKLQEAHGSAELDIKVHEIEAIIIEKMQWKPKENSAINKLFRALDQGSIDSLKVALRIGTAENVSDAVSNRIYEIRNCIAHYRRYSDANKFSGDWPSLINAMISSLFDISTKLQAHLIYV